ncbi:hypothetical protein [Streptomyces sp. NPDC056663]|uniref:hypothetical protein n=1 Tax=Streptomyces sp. NPDC056663 TaxID=3345899 RepID=UPI00368CDA6C
MTRRIGGLFAIGAATLVAAGAAMAVPTFTAPPSTSGRLTTSVTVMEKAKPTVVLVQGASTDSASWNRVVTRLVRDGYQVRTVADPFRGLPTDVAAAKDVPRSTRGPIVLVGQSNDGTVIKNAKAVDPDVKALVRLTALVPDAG